MRSFKRWYNDRYWNEPIRQAIINDTQMGRLRELCGHAWCWRQTTYDHRCWKHQRGP